MTPHHSARPLRACPSSAAPSARLALAILALCLAVAGAARAGDEPIAPTPAVAAGAASATLIVETFHSALIEMMKSSDTMSFDERVAFLTPRMEQAFDLDFMSSKSVGRQWQELTPVQQRAWRQKFGRLTVSNYAGRFIGYQGEHFETLGNETAAKDTVMVLTRVAVPNDADVDLNYRLRQTGDGWRIIDVYLKGTVSELALRRSEYSSTLKRDGFEKLAGAIDEKIAELREEGQDG